MTRYFQDKTEWRRMKRIAFDHPYYDIRAHVLSERKAVRIIRKHQARSAKEILRNAMIECRIPEPHKSEYSHAPIVDRNQNKRIVTAFRFRRVIIAVVVVLAVAGFFTLTKPGIALAQELYEIVVRVFDGTLKVNNNKMPDEVSPIDFSTLTTEYSRLEDVAQATKRVIIVPSSNDGELTGLFVDILSNEMMMVSTKYVRKDGKTYQLVQTIHNENSYWSVAVSTIQDDLKPMTLPLGLTVYFSEMDDGTVYAAAYGAGYDLNVSSTELTLHELRELMQDVQILK